MTAPAMAERLADVSNDAAVERFVDETAHLIRSQAAGIFGNVLAVIPLVLAAQWIARAISGTPLVGAADSRYILDSLTLLGPTPFYALFTGVLLFVSSLIAGWFENWFVWHRLDSAIAWNPKIVARLGAARARRWSVYWRDNISGFASNISLGLMLGLVPPIAAFFALPLDVRHVTLASGQLAAAVGALGAGTLLSAAFWWCVAGIAVTGTFNLGGQLLPRLPGRAALARHPPRRREPDPQRLPPSPLAAAALVPAAAPQPRRRLGRLTMRMPLWTSIVPLVSLPLAGAALVWPPGALLAAVCAIALCVSVLASVHHAEVVAHRVGEPFGTLILAISVTVIEVALIVSMMLSGGPRASPAWRATRSSRRS